MPLTDGVRDSDRRIELNLEEFAWREAALSAAQVGELLRMLFAEAAGAVVTPSRDGDVQAIFEERDAFRRVAGSVRRPPLPLALRRQVYERDGGVCTYCKVEIAWEQYQCDHVVARSRGGSDEIDNLVSACGPCNRSKSDNSLEDWVR